MDRTGQIAELTLKRFVGNDMDQVFNDLATLRIQVFHEFPYLYEGDLEFEKNYLKRYSQSARGFLAALYKDQHMVGAATGLPLADEESFVKDPFLRANMPIEKIFYFGESILLPQYRGKGYGHLFFDEREFYARNEKFEITSFCAVQRPENHPDRPSHYKSLEPFWTKRGYAAQPHLKTEFSWQDIGDIDETKKTMQFWVKDGTKHEI